jgi:solute:Na+ symporter, SSS family
MIRLPLFIILVYFCLVVAIGWLGRRLARDTAQYLIAGRNLGVILCTAAIAGEWLGGMSTVGTAEKAYQSGYFPIWYNISTSLGMVLFGWLLAAVYRRHRVHTVGELLEWLYTARVRWVASLCFVAAFVILAYLQLQTIGSILAQVLGIGYGWAVALAGLLVAVYVSSGGMKSIALVNFINLAFLYVMLLSVCGLVLSYAGGFPGLFARLAEALPAGQAAAFRSPFSAGWGRVAAYLLGGIFAGFASQASIQPAFAARNIRTAKRAAYGSALLIAPVGLLVATLGIAARAGLAGGQPATAKEALPYLLTHAAFIPGWVSGLAMAAIFAAILSTLGPVLFAVATILARDIYLHARPHASDLQVLRVSRLSVVLVSLGSIPLALAIRGSILDSAYITYAIRAAAAIAVLLGVFWRRNGRPVPAAHAVTAGLVSATAAAVLFAAFPGPIARLLGFSVDKVFAALFFSLAAILVVQFWPHKRAS